MAARKLVRKEQIEQVKENNRLLQDANDKILELERKLEEQDASV